MNPALRAVLLVPPFTPARLFRGGEQGWWYDPSDFSTMFQDSAGTTPVTAVEQPVGLQLDKRYGLVRGSELNGDPALTGGWWSANAGIVVGGGKVAFTAVAVGQALYRTSILTAGKTYEVSLTIANYSAGGVRFEGSSGSGSAAGQIAAANGTHTARITTDGTTLYLTARSATTTLEITNISVREIPGNHRLQGTAASRPTMKALGAYYAQLFDGVDDSQATSTGGGASTAAFIQIAFRATQVGVAQTLWSDRTGNTGLKLEITAANALTFSGGNGASINTATGDTVSVDTDYVATAIYEGGVLSVQLNSAAPVTAACTLSAGTATVTMGKDNGAASGFFKGYTYGSVYVKDSAVSASMVAKCRRWLASKGGITL